MGLGVVEKLRIVALVILLLGAGILIRRLYFPDLIAPVTAANYSDSNDPWPEKVRQDYYHRSQGSRLMDYRWFIALEQPTNSKPFLSPELMSQFRSIPDSNPVHNEYRLPVGFAVDDPDPVNGVRNVGITCAACHTGQIMYKGSLMRIEGGSGMIDFDNFLNQMVLSIGTTISPLRPGKFDRFAEKVLGPDHTDSKKRDQLRKDVEAWFREQVENGFYAVVMDRVHRIEATTSGFGRVDALGSGGNALYRKFNVNNLATLTSPVGVPPLWYSGQYGWVQLNGSIRQPTSRNIIESLA